MSDSSELERRYRRLLALYPRAFREEHEQEILAVLMAGAAPDQRRPGPTESADLVRHGLGMRLGQATSRRLRNPTSWEERHRPGLWIWVRVLNGIWLVLLTCLLCQVGHWWALVLLVPAGLHFCIAVRLGRFLGRRRAANGPPPHLPAS